MLQSGHEVMVDLALRLSVSSRCLSSLVLKASELLDWVIQLGVCIADLLPKDEELKTFCDTWLASMPLGQRTHYLRLLNDEGGVHNVVLDVMATQLVHQSRSRTWRLNLKIQLGYQCIQLRHALIRSATFRPIELLSRLILDFF